jgi:hypothetical protein
VAFATAWLPAGAARSAGAVVGWGANSDGQTDGPATPAVSIAAGDYHSCAIQAANGIVVCWGNDNEGQATPPVAVNGTAGTAGAIEAGVYHSCAIQWYTGNAICWGDDS